MKRTNLPLIATIVTFLGLTLSAQAERATRPLAEPGKALVRLQEGQDTVTTRRKLMRVGTIVDEVRPFHLLALRLKPGVSEAQALAWLRQQPEVRYAQPNYYRHLTATPNDPSFSSQYGLTITQTHRAWELWNPQQPVIVGVVDTGLDVNHPDLKNKVTRDAMGVIGYDALKDVVGVVTDDYDHGTHVSGIIGAQVNNNLGVAGVAGWNGLANTSDTIFTKLMPLKVFNLQDETTDLVIVKAILWGIDHGAKILNMSLAGHGYGFALNESLQYAWRKGVLCVASSGNEGAAWPVLPAASRRVLSVAWTNSNDYLDDYSNWGNWVTVAAPGGAVFSTTPGGSYNNKSGTSMASPHAAGEAALLMAQNPALTLRQVRDLIAHYTDPILGPSHRYVGGNNGRINVYHALQNAFNPLPPTNEVTMEFPAQDATVFSTNPDDNFGYDLDLFVSRGATKGDRVSYMMFDLTQYTQPPTSAIFTLRQNSNDLFPVGGNVTMKVYSVANTSWLENNITWNNAPGLNRTNVKSTGTLIATKTVKIEQYGFITIDLTTFIKANVGRVVTLQLINEVAENSCFSLFGYDNGYNPPHLLMAFPPTEPISGRITLPACTNLEQSLTFEFRPVGGGTSVVRTQTLGKNGTFCLPDIPLNNYVLAVKGSKWLQKTTPVDVAGGQVANIQLTLPPGDANDDNHVDIYDLGTLAEAFNTTPIDPSWNQYVDFNCDDSVDIFDLALLAEYFNQDGDL